MADAHSRIIGGLQAFHFQTAARYGDVGCRDSVWRVRLKREGGPAHVKNEAAAPKTFRTLKISGRGLLRVRRGESGSLICSRGTAPGLPRGWKKSARRDGS